MSNGMEEKKREGNREPETVEGSASLTEEDKNMNNPCRVVP